MVTVDEQAHRDAPVVRIRNLTRRFGDQVAVDDVSLDVYPGEIVGLLGPNGAGKSTTLRMLATLMQPDSGTASIAGHDVVADPLGARAVLGYQTGDTGLYEQLTPREFLRYFGRLNRIPDDVLEPRVTALITEFGIASYADRVCRGLSTGQKQRVTLARTVLHRPAALVLDEPTSGLDLLAAQFVLERVRNLAAGGTAVLYSTHIMSEVEILCDRVVILHEGRVIAAGTLAALYAQTQTTSLARAFLALVQGPPPNSNSPEVLP